MPRSAGIPVAVKAPSPCRRGRHAPWGIASDTALRRHLLRGVGTVAALALAGCASGAGRGMFAPAGPIAAAQRTHFWQVVALVSIVVVPAILLGPFLAWRYRYSGEARYAPRWDFSWPVEFVLWGVPTAIVAALSVLLWHATHELDPYVGIPSSLPATRVQAIAQDWRWVFVYPDEGIASVGELAFPADRPVALELTSTGVMHSLLVPSLGGQIYAMAGMTTNLNLAADAPGTFIGENTQYSGIGFQDEKFLARAMTDDDYAAWLADARANGREYDDSVRDALGEPATKAALARTLGLVPTAPPGSPADVLEGEDAVAANDAYAAFALKDVPADLFAEAVGRHAHAMPEPAPVNPRP